MNPKLILLALLLDQSLIAQQNFINVATGETTEKHHIFFQQQLNFNELIQSNTTFDYGIKNNFEAGINILGLNFSEKNRSFIKNDSLDTDPYNPLVLANASKKIKLSQTTWLTVGSQFGVNFRDNRKARGAGLFFINLCLKNLLLKNSSFTIGSYYNTKHYGGQGNRIGAWLGMEIKVREKLHVMAESIFGSNALSYTSFGVIYYPFKWMPLTFGLQIPNTQKNAYSIVFELTIIPGQL